MIKKTSARVVLALVVCGVIATGCTSETAGDPTPGASGSTPAEQTSETTSTKPSTGGGSSLADFDTCEALNAVASQLNLTEIEADGDACDAEFSATTSVRMKAHLELGVADVVPGGEQSDTNVGSRKAKLVKGSTSNASCLIAVEVTPTSRVDIAGSANASQAEACDAVTKVANAIEPKLPK